ncbi:hypothetical protein [Promicromonospora iranensis]|uniref:Uncharacterized protein n=1 Tax=Promicromonospora iranensis TaxID=1105144 RepID=A0ABU2CSX1_9MICO|nr:hypothetical protein [Promicromonospora iranensis]MDR7384434.1 hypothetical protein [Promicromonospora iranensis]
MFEVVLRNAMDEQLCAWNAKQPDTNGGGFHSPDWLMDPAPLLIRLTRNGQDIRKARDHAAASARSWQPSRAGVVRDRLTDVLHVLRAIDTVPEQWAAGQQRVTTVLKARPRCAERTSRAG